MPPARAQHNLDVRLVGATQCVAVFVRELDLRVEEGAIDVNGDKADGARHVLILPTQERPAAVAGSKAIPKETHRSSAKIES